MKRPATLRTGEPSYLVPISTPGIVRAMAATRRNASDERRDLNAIRLTSTRIRHCATAVYLSIRSLPRAAQHERDALHYQRRIILNDVMPDLARHEQHAVLRGERPLRLM